MKTLLLSTCLCFAVSSAAAQKAGPPPSKLSALDAVARADKALHAYQQTQIAYKDLPPVAATFDADAEPVVIGGMALALVKAKLNGDKPILDGLALATAFANVDATTVNAALTTAALVTAHPQDMPDKERHVRAAQELADRVRELKEASDALWDVLEKYMSQQTCPGTVARSEPPTRRTRCAHAPELCSAARGGPPLQLLINPLSVRLRGPGPRKIPEHPQSTFLNSGDGPVYKT